MNKKPEILVVEDETSLVKAIKKMLSVSGFEAITARSVKEAGVLLEKNPRVRAIWLDHYLLGQEDGMDLVISLNNDKRRKKIPVFVVSNSTSAEKLKSYVKLGVNKYYAK